MTETNFRFKNGDRVRLKMDRAEVYPRAFGGSEGVVRRRRVDSLGHHNLVYIEWDKQHWTYNGENDMWAFEDHFDLVERLEMPKEEKPDFIEALKALIENYQGDGKKGEDPETSEDKDREYLEVLDAATEHAKKCEAFMLIGVSREKHPLNPGQTVLIPDFFSSYKSEEGGLLLESQGTQVAAACHQELVTEAIRDIITARGLKEGGSGDNA